MYSVLYQEIIPPNGGGDTMFASAYKAYEELSPSMKTYLEGKTATHDGARGFDKNADVYPVSVHPVVVRHPESGRKLLFVNREFTSHINEVPPAESRGVLEFLYDHIARSHWSMRFRWTDIRSRSGTTAAPSTLRSGTIGRMSAPATGCSSRAPSGRLPVEAKASA